MTNKVEQFIFRTKVEKPKGFKDIEKAKKTKGYTYSGIKAERLVDVTSSVAYAKEEYINGRTRYYVKLAKFGRNSGKLPNPKNIGFSNGETAIRIGGVDVYQWHHVKKQVFTDYVNFLNTGEVKWLRAAQSHLQS